MAHPKNLSSSSSSSSSSSTIAVANRFVRDSVQFLIRCKRPDKREFIKVAQAVGTGFIIMGFIGYFIKLIHIPINNIIVA